MSKLSSGLLGERSKIFLVEDFIDIGKDKDVFLHLLKKFFGISFRDN